MVTFDTIVSKLPRKLDLNTLRLSKVLELMGFNETKLPPVFHVAGTNGKGSTCALLRYLLASNGYKSHVFTSPHLIHWRERIRVANELITDESLFFYYHRYQQVASHIPLTFFELMTCIAFMAFSETPAEATIIEVGLGGLYDATNVLKKPAVSLITNITRDHIELLGPSLANIAYNKAGIIKPFIPAVTTETKPEVLAVLQQVADYQYAPLLKINQDFQVTPLDSNRWLYQYPAHNITLTLPQPALNGQHQQLNAALALTAFYTSKLHTLSEIQVVKSFQEVKWAGRLMPLQSSYLTHYFNLPFQVEWWVDGAHNIDGVKQFTHFIDSLDDSHLNCAVVNILSNKDIQPMLFQLQQTLPVVVVDQNIFHPNQPVQGRGTLASHLSALTEHQVLAIPHLEGLKAWLIEKNPHHKPLRVFFTGSLHFVGSVMEFNQEVIV